MDQHALLWADLAAQMGEDSQRWRISPLARRNDPHAAMVVLRLDGPQGRRLVLKQQIRPLDQDGFAASVQAHLTAHEAFPDGVPPLHAVDLEAQAVVMGFVAGETLSERLRAASPKQQARLLARAGAWMSQFHRRTLGPPRVFQPKFTLNYLRKVMEEVETGQRQVAEPTQFLRAARGLVSRQSDFEGRKTEAALTHGDLHLRNLMVSGRPMDITGLDFKPGRLVPVGHDIGRLLADYALVIADPTVIRPGEVLPDTARDAFFEGYDLVQPDDPSVQLLLRHRVLAEWWGLPALAEQRSLAQARRWVALTLLAPRVFPDSR